MKVTARAYLHVLGLRVGLDLAHADLDLHALAEEAAVVERHVGSLVQVAAQRVPGSGSGLGLGLGC